MAFCGQCGLLLNTNATKCPRCGAATDFDVAIVGNPEADNTATVIAHTDNKHPSPLDARNAGYYTPSGDNAYPEQRARQADHPSASTYLIPKALQPQSSNTFTAPDASAPDSIPQRGDQIAGIYQPGGVPSTPPSYPFQPPTSLRKTRKWPFILIIVLIVALLAVTAMFFALGPGLFSTNNTPKALVTPTPQPAPTTAQQNTPATGSTPIQQAQATIQHYYADINSQDYQDAYNLWVSNPDNYNHYKQGFAHTYHDDITFGKVIPQVDGTVQVNITLQATEDEAGGGTKISTYQGYYTVGQQADGSWKIIAGQLA